MSKVATQLSLLDLMIDRPPHHCMGFLCYAYDQVDIYWDCGCIRARRVNAIMAWRDRARRVLAETQD